MTPKIIKKEYQSGLKAEIILKPHFYQRFFGIIVDFGSSDPDRKGCRFGSFLRA